MNPPVQNLRRPETSISAKLREGATETDVGATGIGGVVVPGGGAHVVLKVVPRAAPQHATATGLWARWITPR